MSILSQLNSPAMYAICGGIVAFVALICIVFHPRVEGRSCHRDGPDKDEARDRLERDVSALPSVGILLGVIALSGSLGTPWPWLRLSVIGALHYETQVAQAAAEQVGMKSLSAAEMTPAGFATIALLMSLCIIWGIVLSILFNKRYTKKLLPALRAERRRRASAILPHDGDVHRPCERVYRQLSRRLYLRERPVHLLRRLDAAGRGGRLGGRDGAVCIWRRKKHITWVENFSIAGSMLAGMAAAVLIGLVWVEGKAMEQKQKDALWAQYTKQTHRLGRVLSLITIALLLGAPFVIGALLGAYPTSARRRGIFVRGSGVDRQQRGGISDLHADAGRGRRLSGVHHRQSHQHEDPLRGECPRSGGRQDRHAGKMRSSPRSRSPRRLS